jgi:hypothetical protein
VAFFKKGPTFLIFYVDDGLMSNAHSLFLRLEVTCILSGKMYSVLNENTVSSLPRSICLGRSRWDLNRVRICFSIDNEMFLQRTHREELRNNNIVEYS